MTYKDVRHASTIPDGLQLNAAPVDPGPSLQTLFWLHLKIDLPHLPPQHQHPMLRGWVLTGLMLNWKYDSLYRNGSCHLEVFSVAIKAVGSTVQCFPWCRVLSGLSASLIHSIIKTTRNVQRFLRHESLWLCRNISLDWLQDINKCSSALFAWYLLEPVPHTHTHNSHRVSHQFLFNMLLHCVTVSGPPAPDELKYSVYLNCQVGTGSPNNQTL